MNMPDSAERLQVLQQLGRTYRAFLSAYEKEVGHFLPRWRVMLHLYQQGKPSPQKQVGEASFMDPGALSRQLSALEALGWIKRDTDPHDKRITNVSLTKQGKREVERSLPKRTAFMEHTLGDMSDAQLHQLRDSLLLLETRFNTRSGQRDEENQRA
jgi:MarR family transcriptional regulator, organic hydroperoxide resistance regulator